MTGVVDAEECQQLREWRCEGLPVPQIRKRAERRKVEVNEHVRGECDHDCPPVDPLVSWIKAYLAQLAANSGGKILRSATELSEGAPVSSRQVGQLLRYHLVDEDGPLSVERWGGTTSPWVIELTDDVDPETIPQDLDLDQHQEREA